MTESTNRCGICGRDTISGEFERKTAFDWIDEMSYDCGGHCSGCVAVAEDRAVYAHCAFHDRLCVVWKHYGASTHLCSPERCIEHQDITTLMLNDAYERWKEGEPNDFLERFVRIATELEDDAGDD